MQRTFAIQKLGTGVLLAALLLVPQSPLAALDEQDSLAILVETLQRVDNPSIQSSLLKGMLSGLEGRRNMTAPEGWTVLSEQLSHSEDKNVRNLALQLSQIFGDVKATQRALAMVKDSSAPISARRTALRSLLSQQNQAASQLLEVLLQDSHLQLDAIRGYAIVENPRAAELLLGMYDELSPELRRAVIETLATRKLYAEALLMAIKNKKVSRDEIPAHVARSLQGILGPQFVKVFGKVKSVAVDRQKMMARYKKMITPAALTRADASRGRAVFKKTCAACHVLYDDGGKIGPDLTGSNRANLDYLLLNSVDPSYDVPAGYKMVVIVTVDGRVVNGVIAEEDGTRVVLKTVEQPRLVIAKEDIEIRNVSPKSMMPDGQLDKMKPQEVIDLIKYLRTTEQVEMAK